jgi:hypothetical protein
MRRYEQLLCLRDFGTNEPSSTKGLYHRKSGTMRGLAGSSSPCCALFCTARHGFALSSVGARSGAAVHFFLWAICPIYPSRRWGMTPRAKQSREYTGVWLDGLFPRHTDCSIAVFRSGSTAIAYRVGCQTQLAASPRRPGRYADSPRRRTSTNGGGRSNCSMSPWTIATALPSQSRNRSGATTRVNTRHVGVQYASDQSRESTRRPNCNRGRYRAGVGCYGLPRLRGK